MHQTLFYSVSEHDAETCYDKHAILFYVVDLSKFILEEGPYSSSLCYFSSHIMPPKLIIVDRRLVFGN
jgi:hypothetical protein